MTALQENLGFWYDGRFCAGDRLTLSIQDPGLLYGATLFTTLRVFEQTLDHPKTDWGAHLDRLQHFRSQLSPLWQEADWQRLRVGAERMSQLFPVLRLTLFPDGREWITGRSLPADLTQRQTQGIQATLMPPEFSRSLPHLKTGNYLAPWLGLQQAMQQDSQEAIFTDSEGNWLETMTGNLWGYRSGVWYTPSLGNLLPGIQRSRVIEQLRAASIPVEECLWTPEFAQSLEAMAYSNCVVGVVPIRSVVGVWEGDRWAIVKQLQE